MRGLFFPKKEHIKEALKKAQIAGDKSAICQIKPGLSFLQNQQDANGQRQSFSRSSQRPFIRMFLLEAYMIPTSSMEGSLMVGDFLFVSKVHYGVRTPKTVAMIPLLHNTIPLIGSESYLKKPDIKPKRLPKIDDIGHNDPVVFNFPEGDSVYVTPGRTWSTYDVRRNPRSVQIQSAVKGKKLRVRPFDKMDHYIKRCVGLPGDSLEVRNRQLFINGKSADNPTNIQFLYEVHSPSIALNKNKLLEWGINLDDINAMRSANGGFFHLNSKQVEKLKGMGKDVIVQHVDMSQTKGRMFPHDPDHFQWSNDNYGPIYIPKAGETIVVTPRNIALYRRVIQVYERNDVQIKNGRIFINGDQATQYTFKQNYYWMMGDNRHNSEDSRVWGFVPADHVVGKPLFIWLSLKNGKLANGINWSRIFSSAKKM